jgi:uncharacterized phage protein gp47/JayE
MSEFTPDGIVIDRLDDIFNALIADLKSFYGENIKTDPKSNFGGLSTIWSEAVADQNELIEAVVSAHSPSKASGVFLSELVAFNGITRNEAEFTTVPCNLIANTAGSTVPAGTIFSDPVTGNQVALDSEQVIAPSATELASCTALTEGPVEFEVNTITKIETPVYGLESVNNPAKAITGRNEESDTELRARRWQAATVTASTNDGAIFKAIADIQETTDVKVHSNKTPDIDSFGVPPGQIWAIVEGASDADIAKAIYDHTSAGIGWFGSVTEPYIDPDSLDSYDIKFSRPDYNDIWIIVNLTKNPEFGEYPGDGDDQIKQNIVDYFDEFQKLSIDVVNSRLYTPINLVPGHSIDSVLIGLSSPPTLENDIPMIINQKAITELAKITVNS